MIIASIEEYYNDNHYTCSDKPFSDLSELEDWVFQQMRQDYSDARLGSHAMLFPTEDIKQMSFKNGPSAISFIPDSGSAHYFIHMIRRNDGGILFSDGKYTCGQRHWSAEVKKWLAHCSERQYTPTFNFVA